MGISGALYNAASGLSAAARLADTVANNVANAQTPGFARRTTELSSLTLGGYGSGVRVTGTSRAENVHVTAERRGMDASAASAGTLSSSYERIVSAVGEADSPNSLAALATRFETDLMGATASPQSTTKLTAAVESARSLADALNRISGENVRIRTEADAEIGRTVDTINDALHAVDAINKKIATLSTQGVDVTGLQDERSRIIDSISPLVPLRTVKRPNDQLAIYSANGGVLLDGQVYELDFTPAANVVTADMTIGAGLSGLRQDQNAAGGLVTIAAGTGGGLFDGGALGALFEVRDTVVPEFDAELDRYAADLVDRFESVPASVDGSGNGIFVDAGAGPGLAGRVGINAAVDPNVGGYVWRLRDGLAAAAPGEVGNGSVLQALTDAMAQERAPTGFISTSALGGAATFAQEIASYYAGRAARSDDQHAYLTARQSTLSEAEGNLTGVDSDSQLQSLMLIEQAYAANAKVLSVIDDLMQLLMEV
jgi:flagellar hook-associated protein 1